MDASDATEPPFRTVSEGVFSEVHIQRSDSPAHAPSRGACTKCSTYRAAHPHRVRSAKLAGNTGMASGPTSRTNRGKQPQQARQRAEDGGRKEQ
jgi:hypothetical protein